MSSTDVDFTRRKQMGIIAHEEAELMSEKSRLEVFNDILKLSWEEIEMGNTIGFGGFSQVFKVRITRPNEAGEFDDTEYALKCLNPSTMNRTKSFKTGAVDIALEAEILSRLHHPNVIMLHGVNVENPRIAYISSDRGFFLVLDLLEDTLRNKIDKYRMQNPKLRKGSAFERSFGRNGDSGSINSSSAVLERIKSIGIGVAQGMEYLHEQGVVLRDLKPDNVGFDRKGTPKIFDLGFAREVHTLKAKEVAGSLRYMAPEIALGRPTLLASDVYSFGVLLWEMVTLDKPYKHIQDRDEFIDSVMVGGWRQSSSAMPSTALRKLVKECWDKNPEKRPEFTRVVKVLKVETSLVSTSKKGGFSGMPLLRTATFSDTSGLSRKDSFGKMSTFKKKMSTSSFGLLKNMSRGSRMTLDPNQHENESLATASSSTFGGGRNAQFNLSTPNNARKTKLNSRLAATLLSSPTTPSRRLTSKGYGKEEAISKDPEAALFKRRSKKLEYRSKKNSSCPDLAEE